MRRQIITERDLTAFKQAAETHARGADRVHPSPGIGGDLAGVSVEPPPPASADIELPEPDSYVQRLLKFIPAEIVGLYIMLSGITRALPNDDFKSGLEWVVFGVLLAATPAYLRRALEVKKGMQLVLSTVAFAVWAFAQGGPFAVVPHQTVLGAVILPLFTVLVAIVKP